MNKKLFSKRLSARRSDVGYKTQYALAKAYNEEFGAKRKDEAGGNEKEFGGILGTIKNYENESHKGSPNLEKVCNLCKLLGCDVSYLVGDYDELDYSTHKVCEHTGLKKDNVSKLHEIVSVIKEKPYIAQHERVYIYAINAIIGSKEFQRILDRIWSAYCIKHQRALGGLAPKYPDEEEAKQRVDEIKAEFNSLADFGATSERIVSGDIAISVLLDDARDAIVSIAREIVNADIIEPQEGAVGNG